MSALLEQVAKELGAFAVAELIQLPPALPPPKPAAPAAPKPAAPAAAAVAKPATVASAPAAAAASPTPPAPRPAPATAAPAVVPKPVQFWNFAEKGIHLEVTITPDKVVEAAQVMDKHGFAMDAVTGMDWLSQGLMEVIYDFLHFQSGERVVFRARIPRAEPKIATISHIFGGANWHERETKDMYGIIFVGHPDLTPFLLPDDADYHPLRKDFNP